MKDSLLIFLFAAGSLSAQIIVKSGMEVRIPAPGGTSAVSLDQHVAEATLKDGILRVAGIDPGDTEVVAFKTDGVSEFSVHVSPGPPHFPPGFVAPEDVSNETGSYGTLFSSDRLLVENSLDLEHRGLAQTTQLHFVGASFAGQDQALFVPSAYYRIVSRHSDVTLLDRTVNESPLTLQNVVLRGLHVEKGDWHFHAGYTASAQFADVLIPTEKELAAGLTAGVWLSPSMTITPGIYFLRSVDLTNGRPHLGLITSLLWSGKYSHHWEVRGEVAYGGGVAYAGELHHNTEGTQLNATIMQRKLSFPSLRTSSLPGLSGAVTWTQLLGPRWSLFSGGSVSDILLQTTRQDSHMAFANTRARISRSWSASSGFNYGSFSTGGLPGVKTFTLPQQINFDRPRFGAGFLYRFSGITNSLSNGDGFTQTLHASVRHFQWSEFFDWQKDALSVNSLSSQLPAIQQALQKLGILSASPEQLSSLLQDAAFLHTLGFANQAQILTIPRRLEEGGSLSWFSAGPHPHQLSASFLSSVSSFAGSQTKMSAFTGSYAKTIGNHNFLQANCSVVESNALGQESQTSLVSVSFRHTFSRASGMFAGEKRTGIDGTVFVDRTRRGVYVLGSELVPGATVILDGQRSVMTDASGHFHFGGVSEGDHQVHLKYISDSEHYFTTPIDTVVTGGGSVDFGVAFVENDLWGYVKDDTGNGLGDVRLVVKGMSGNLSLSTDKSGKFDLPNVQPGSYSIAVDPESVELGYSTDELTPIAVQATVRSTPHPVFKIPAMRSFTGRVTVYDPGAGRYVAVKGAALRVAMLGRDTLTDGDGRFLLTGLPAGDLEMTLTMGHSTLRVTIYLPVQPVMLRRDFSISSLNGQIASTAGSESQ